MSKPACRAGIYFLCASSWLLKHIHRVSHPLITCCPGQSAEAEAIALSLWSTGKHFEANTCRKWPGERRRLKRRPKWEFGNSSGLLAGKYFRLYRWLYLFIIGHSWIWFVISICKWKMNNILYILCCETMHVNLKSSDSYLLCLMQNKERTS